VELKLSISWREGKEGKGGGRREEGGGRREEEGKGHY
jgi:hypothetical protein